MDREKKSHSKLKWVVVGFALFAVVLIATAYSFFKSPAFIRMIEERVEANLSLELEIGSIRLGGLKSITLTEIVVKSPRAQVPLLKLDRARIGFSIPGLIRREIESLLIVGPAVYIDLSERRIGLDSEDAGLERTVQTAPSVPFVLKRLSIEDATIVVRLAPEGDGTGKEDGLLRLGPVKARLTSRRVEGVTGNEGLELSLIASATSSRFASEDRYELELSGLYDAAQGEFSVTLARITSGLIGTIDAKGLIGGIGSGAPELDLKLDAGPLSLAGVDHAFLPAGLSLSGELTGEGSLIGRMGKGLKWDLALKVSGLAVRARGFDISAAKVPLKLSSKGSIDLSLPKGGPVIDGVLSLALNDATLTGGEGEGEWEGQVAGEGIDLLIENKFRFEPTGDSAAWAGDYKIDAVLKGFEFLAGDLYLDFIDREIIVTTSGRYAGEALTMTGGRVEFSDIATLGFDGVVLGVGGGDKVGRGGKGEKAPLSFDLRLALKEFSNKRFFDAILKGSYEDRFPILKKLDVSGTASMELELKGTRDGFSAFGELVISDTYAAVEDSALDAAPVFTLEGLTINQPFYLRYPVGFKAAPRKKRYGSVSIDSVSFKDAVITDINFSPGLWDDRLDFADDISIPVFSGLAKIKDAVFENITTPSRELSLSVGISDIELSEVSAILGLAPFNGKLTGTIPVVLLSGTSLKTEGVIELNLFGGAIRIRGISMDDMFSPASSLRSSIEIDNLNLAELTRTFEFGLITGILRGYVQDLVIKDGQPVSFLVHMETVKTRGVAQRIDVKALKKIQIFSSGTSVSVLDKGIYRIFKEYGYSKMGFSGRLKDDRFSLKGVETQGDKSYIVLGSLRPPRVDVVSYTGEISFAEVLKRIKRVQQID